MTAESLNQSDCSFHACSWWFSLLDRVLPWSIGMCPCRQFSFWVLDIGSRIPSGSRRALKLATSVYLYVFRVWDDWFFLIDTIASARDPVSLLPDVSGAPFSYCIFRMFIVCCCCCSRQGPGRSAHVLLCFVLYLNFSVRLELAASSNIWIFQISLFFGGVENWREDDITSSSWPSFYCHKTWPHSLISLFGVESRLMHIYLILPFTSIMTGMAVCLV